MEPSELVIVKHAEAACDVAGVVGGPRGDTGLTTSGRVQAACAALHLALEPGRATFTAVYTGSRPRLLETAAIIASVLGVPLRRYGPLGGQRYGASIDAQPWSAVHRAFGGSPTREPHRALAQDGESWNAYVARVGRALTRLTARHPGERIVVVGGSGVVDASLGIFCDLPERGADRGAISWQPTGLTRWREVPAEEHNPSLGLQWSLIEHNAAEHLPMAARMLEAA